MKLQWFNNIFTTFKKWLKDKSDVTRKSLLLRSWLNMLDKYTTAWSILGDYSFVVDDIPIDVEARSKRAGGVEMDSGGIKMWVFKDGSILLHKGSRWRCTTFYEVVVKSNEKNGAKEQHITREM